jgi:hypothetical protein
MGNSHPEWKETVSEPEPIISPLLKDSWITGTSKKNQIAPRRRRKAITPINAFLLA